MTTGQPRAPSNVSKSVSKSASILIVNRTYPPLRGATGRLMHDLARHFVKSGHRVTILCTGTGKPSITSRGPISVVRVRGVERPGALDWVKGLYRLYRAMISTPRHDVIITMTDPPLLYVLGQRAAKAKGSAHVHWSQDVYPDLAPALGFRFPGRVLGWAERVGRAALREAACVVCISRCMQRHLVRTGLDIRRTAVIENWPDQETLAPPENTAIKTRPALRGAEALRERRLYSDPAGQRFRVLYAGSISRAHPMEAVLEAARILQKSHPDIEMVFVGKGEGFDRLAAARAQKGLDNVRLIPPQPRASLRTLMESGDVHLVTMRDETLGLLLPSKFYSALASERPSVFAGPSECDVANIIARFGCGRVVAPGDGRAMATAIALYRTDSEAWFSAQDGARAALKGRTPQDAFSSWSDVIRKVLK